MRVVMILSSAALLATVAMTQAQGQSTSTTSTTGTTSQQLLPLGDYGSDYRSGYHASTAAEGFLRGWADLARGMGDYNYYTSKGMINATEARRRAIENQQKWLQAYFDLRQMNTARRALVVRPASVY